MPKYGEFTDGGAGQSTDTIIVKRGTQTLRTTLDQLPIPAATNDILNSKVDDTTFLNQMNQFTTDLTTGLASKQDVLNFYGNIRKTGNNVTVDPFIVAGSVLDGRSAFMVPGSSNSLSSPFGNWTNPFQTGTLANRGSSTGTSGGNPANDWEGTSRIECLSAAAANSQAKIYWGPRVRFPFSETTTNNGFKGRIIYAASDAIDSAQAFGIFQTNPTAGTQPSAYTGGRVYFSVDKGGTNWVLRVNGTVIATLSNTDFPVLGGASRPNPMIMDVVATPFPNWGIYIRLRHWVTGAEYSTTYTGTFAGNWDPLFICVRDTIDGTAAVKFETTGYATGAYIENVQGEPAQPTPNTLTTSTTISRIPHANVDNFINSGTAATITIPNTGFVAGDYFYGTNIGTGAVSFAGSGFTINKDANVPTTVGQYQSFSLVCISNGNWVRLS